jgi:hypothetical protein
MRHSNQIGIFWQVEISAIWVVQQCGLKKVLIKKRLDDVQATICRPALAA